MPSIIPYDSSLILANIEKVEKSAHSQAPVDAAQEELQLQLERKRGLETTKAELAGLSIDTQSLENEVASVDEMIKRAAENYATEKIKAEGQIRSLRDQLRAVHAPIEASSVDSAKNQVKTRPLAADSFSNGTGKLFSLDDDGNEDEDKEKNDPQLEE